MAAGECPMKVLAISHSSVVESYQGKLRRLAQIPGVSVDLLLPPLWHEGGGVIEAKAVRRDRFETVVLPAYRLNRIASYFYNPWRFNKAIASDPHSIMYVEEEPWSLAAFQSVRAAKRIHIPSIFFTWENLRLRYKMPSERILRYVLGTCAAAVAGNADAAAIVRERGFRNPVLVLPQYGADPDTLRGAGNCLRRSLHSRNRSSRMSGDWPMRKVFMCSCMHSRQFVATGAWRLSEAEPPGRSCRSLVVR